MLSSSSRILRAKDCSLFYAFIYFCCCRFFTNFFSRLFSTEKWWKCWAIACSPLAFLTFVSQPLWESLWHRTLRRWSHRFIELKIKMLLIKGKVRHRDRGNHDGVVVGGLTTKTDYWLQTGITCCKRRRVTNPPLDVRKRLTASSLQGGKKMK